jgi:hypothetical protein
MASRSMGSATQVVMLVMLVAGAASYTVVPGCFRGVRRPEWIRRSQRWQMQQRPADGGDIRTPVERINAMGVPMRVGYVDDHVDSKAANQKRVIQDMGSSDNWWDTTAETHEMGGGDELPPNWVLHHTVSGRAFYRNVVTGVSTQTRPGMTRVYRWGQWGAFEDRQTKPFKPVWPHWQPSTAGPSDEEGLATGDKASLALDTKCLDSVWASDEQGLATGEKSPQTLDSKHLDRMWASIACEESAEEEDTRTLVRRALPTLDVAPRQEHESNEQNAVNCESKEENTLDIDTRTLVRRARQVRESARSDPGTSTLLKRVRQNWCRDESGSLPSINRVDTADVEDFFSRRQGAAFFEPAGRSGAASSSSGVEDTCQTPCSVTPLDIRTLDLGQHGPGEASTRGLSHPKEAGAVIGATGGDGEVKEQVGDEQREEGHMDEVLSVLFQHDREMQVALNAGRNGLTSFHLAESLQSSLVQQRVRS